MLITQTVDTTITKRIELTDDVIRSLLPIVPAGAEIVINVPDGGDWSNCKLDVTKHCPIVIQWTEHGIVLPAPTISSILAALIALFDDYKALADSGDAGNWRLEDTPVGKQAIAAIGERTQ